LFKKAVQINIQRQTKAIAGNKLP